MAEGELEQAVSDCRSLAADYMKDESASTLDLAAVLRLLAKVPADGTPQDGDVKRAVLSIVFLSHLRSLVRTLTLS